IASKYSWSMPMYLALPRRASSRVAIVSIDFASTSSVRPYTSSNGIPTPSSCDPQRSSGRIRGTKHYGRFAGIAGSIRFNARELHHLAPLFGLFGDQLAEVSRRTRKHRAAEIGEPRLHRGIGESHIDLLVECVDDLGGRVPGCAEAAPRARLKAWQELAHGWEVRQRLPARRRRHRQWTQLVGPDLLYRQRRGAEQNLHLSAKQVGHHGSPATIRHMNQVDPGHHLEKLASNMAGASDAGRSQIDLARVRLGISDELGDRLGRHGWIYHHHYGLAGDAQPARC